MASSSFTSNNKVCPQSQETERSVFIPRHQNVNKPKSKAARTVYRPLFVSFYKITVSFFFFFLSRCKQNKIKLCYKTVKETQIDTV